MQALVNGLQEMQKQLRERGAAAGQAAPAEKKDEKKAN